MLRFVTAPFISIILALGTLACAEQLTRFDFEDGTLQGWTVVSGEAGKLPTGPETMRKDQNFGQQGRYFIGLYENPARDEAQIVLQSPVFTIKSNIISLLIGGGDHYNHCYIALYKAEDNTELKRETGRNSEYMTRRYWDVSSFKGQQVYLKIVDSHTGGWGHINVDDIREMTYEEEEARAKELAARRRRYEKWLASIGAPSKRRVYSGDALLDVHMPLGGIGSEHVSISGDGAVRQWCIFNRVNEGCVVPHSFFAVWAKAKHKSPVAKLLQQTSVDNLPAIEKVEFVGEYPIAELLFIDRQLPVQVKLRAFSPHIPMNAKDSAIPAAVFEFTVTNRGTEDVQVSLMSTLQNPVGYDGISAINGIWNKDYGGNANSPISGSNFRGVLLKNLNLEPNARQFGTMASIVLKRSAVVTPQWDNILELWREFSASGDVSRIGRFGSSPKGRTWNSAITVPFVLSPGQSVRVPFVWAWHFPNNFVWWDNREGQPKIGRMYSNWFADAGKVAEYLAVNYCRLSGDTEKYRRTFYKTTLPYWMLDRISAQNSTMVSTTTMWLEDGTFAAFEGAGCCPMNCTHVWNYEQQMAHLFPELERNMRRTDYEVQQDSNGAIRHRTRLPLTLPRETGPFVDGHLGCILKAYREHRLSKDQSWLNIMWPRVKRAMEFVLNEWDHNKDGVLVCEQWNTYDAAMYGPNTFIGTLYLGALRASEEMAKTVGDDEFATKCRSIYETGAKRLDSVLWNGEYWQQIETKPSDAEVGENKWLLEDWPNENPASNVNRPYGKGCHADQLLGQWWASLLDLGYLLPKDRVNKALDSIMKYNWVPDFGEVRQWPRAFAGENDPGLYICTWPYGGKPENETLYSFEVWTGIEYEVAGLLLQEGRYKEALQIVKAVSDRYNGVPRAPIQRNPFAEVECSNHYARAMSAWGILLAAQGYKYCGPDKSIEFHPVVQPENHASFFTGAEGWGLFTQRRCLNSQENTLTVEYGKLEIKTLTLHLPAGADTSNFKTSIYGTETTYNVYALGEKVKIEFAQPIVVSAGYNVGVLFSWR